MLRKLEISCSVAMQTMGGYLLRVNVVVTKKLSFEGIWQSENSVHTVDSVGRVVCQLSLRLYFDPIHYYLATNQNQSRITMLLLHHANYSQQTLNSFTHTSPDDSLPRYIVK
jgi:hypothetical protein